MLIVNLTIIVIVTIMKMALLSVNHEVFQNVEKQVFVGESVVNLKENARSSTDRRVTQYSMQPSKIMLSRRSY